MKAIAWCPWEGSKVLATGGGHTDGYLRFWNNSNGTCQQAIKTDSQVFNKKKSFNKTLKIISFRYHRYFGQQIINKL
jgi:WD40 repeat protein